MCIRDSTKDRDIGFAFDLDGDRLVIVINGEKKNPDVTLGIGVVKALEIGCKNFVLSQDTSISVEKYINKTVEPSTALRLERQMLHQR